MYLGLAYQTTLVDPGKTQYSSSSSVMTLCQHSKAVLVGVWVQMWPEHSLYLFHILQYDVNSLV